MKVASIAPVLLLFALCGCGSQTAPHYQRFVPVGNNASTLEKANLPSIPAGAALALDTKTGSLCVTFQYKIDVDFPQFKNLPLCKDLYEKNPD